MLYNGFAEISTCPSKPDVFLSVVIICEYAVDVKSEDESRDADNLL